MSEFAVIREALAGAEQACRYHGTNFEFLGTEPYSSGELPRCDSCKQPWRVHRALDALAQLLGDDKHVVEFRQDGWTIMHPLACRPRLFECQVNRAAERQLAAGPPPDSLGRYACAVDEAGAFTVGDAIPGGAS